MKVSAILLLLLWINSQSGRFQAASLPTPLPINEEETKDNGDKTKTALAETQPPDELLQTDDDVNDDGSSELGDEILLSDLVENMDTASLVLLIGKLKEEYVAKAGAENADRVGNAFDRLLTTVLDLSSEPESKVVSSSAELLDMLSEEEPDDDDEIYTDFDDSSDEEENDEPSLQDFQSWNRRATEEDFSDNI